MKPTIAILSFVLFHTVPFRSEISFISIKRLGLIFLLVLLYISTFSKASNAQTSDILDLGHKLAKQIGIIHQMQLNCNLRSQQTPEATSILFGNFIPKENIKSVMVDYYKSIEDLRSQDCKRDELEKQFTRTGTAIKQFVEVGKITRLNNRSKITPHTSDELSPISKIETPFFRGEVSILAGISIRQSFV